MEATCPVDVVNSGLACSRLSDWCDARDLGEEGPLPPQRPRVFRSRFLNSCFPTVLELYSPRNDPQTRNDPQIDPQSDPDPEMISVFFTLALKWSPSNFWNGVQSKGLRSDQNKGNWKFLKYLFTWD